MSEREVVVLSGVRTAVADFGGSLKDVPPTELAGKVIAEAVSRSGLEAGDIGHCVVGLLPPFVNKSAPNSANALAAVMFLTPIN